MSPSLQNPTSTLATDDYMAIFAASSQRGLYLNAVPPNSALQRAAFGIKCSAAGGRAQSAHERWRARVLRGQRAVAELGS